MGNEALTHTSTLYRTSLGERAAKRSFIGTQVCFDAVANRPTMKRVRKDCDINRNETDPEKGSARFQTIVIKYKFQSTTHELKIIPESLQHTNWTYRAICGWAFVKPQQNPG